MKRGLLWRSRQRTGRGTEGWESIHGGHRDCGPSENLFAAFRDSWELSAASKVRESHFITTPRPLDVVLFSGKPLDSMIMRQRPFQRIPSVELPAVSSVIPWTHCLVLNLDLMPNLSAEEVW